MQTLFDISDIGQHLFVGGNAKFTHGINVEDTRDGTDDSSDSGRNSRGDRNHGGNCSDNCNTGSRDVRWH